MKVVWPHKVSVRLAPDSDAMVVLEPGQPFDMPDEEALARVAVGNVDPLSQEEFMAAQDRRAKKAAAERQPDGMVLEDKPDGVVLESKAKKKAADPNPSSEVAV